jgi:hypothetical protein
MITLQELNGKLQAALWEALKNVGKHLLEMEASLICTIFGHRII